MILDENSLMDLNVYKDYLKCGLYEMETSLYLLNNLTLGNTFVDIGANSGYYTLLASSLVGPTGLVFSFEPYLSHLIG